MKLKRIVRTLALAALAFAAATMTTASRAGNGPEGLLDADHPRVKAVLAVQEEVTPGLMNQPEILGTALGEDIDGEIVLVIYVNVEAKNHGEVMRALPPELKGKRVRPELTNPFVALRRGGRVSHTAKQTPPIQLGTSGGWRYDLANGYCCGGTLGSLVQIGGTQYILSNYHVLESDTVLGGNGRKALSGDPIIQPGLIDVGCNANNAQNVATLVVRNALPGSNVDCAIAPVIAGMVRSDGSILGIGTISASTVSASLSKAVKKSGRTTGLTRSTISGINATVSVTYENECAGGTAFTKTFTGQIIINNTGSKFLAGGDSGSLMVEDVTTNPRAVGLLFAGSYSLAVANPIGQVLSFLGASMVGQ